MNDTLKDKLVRLRDWYVEDPTRWRQHVGFVLPDDSFVAPFPLTIGRPENVRIRENIVGACLRGGMYLVDIPRIEFDEVFDWVLPKEIPVEWNDRDGRTVEQVIELLNMMIRRLEVQKWK